MPIIVCRWIHLWATCIKIREAENPRPCHSACCNITPVQSPIAAINVCDRLWNWNFIYNAYIWKIAYFCWYRSIFCVFKGVNCNQRIANVYVVFGYKTYRLFVLNQFLWYLCINKHWFSELHATLILTAKTFKNDEKGLRRGVEALFE